MNAQMNVSYRNENRKNPDRWWMYVVSVCTTYMVLRVVISLIFNV